MVFAVFFTMLLVTANTMALSVRERTNEIGVLKTLGFSRDRFSGSSWANRCCSRSSVGSSASDSARSASRRLAPFMKKYFPVFEIADSTIITALVLMVALGVITGLWPALTAMRLKIVDALRRG